MTPERGPSAGRVPRLPTTSTFQLFKGGRLLSTLVDGCSDVDPGWEHHRAVDPEALPRIVVPPRWRDSQWFLTDTARVWTGVEIRRI